MKIDTSSISYLELEGVYDGVLLIHFCYENQTTFYLECKSDNDKWTPYLITHNFGNEKLKYCHLCGDQIANCDSCGVLGSLMEEFYHYMMNHPSVRLKLLFL